MSGAKNRRQFCGADGAGACVGFGHGACHRALGTIPTEARCDAIVVENDRLDRKDPALEAEPRDLELLEEQQIVEIAREAGIVGMGGAGLSPVCQAQGTRRAGGDHPSQRLRM